MRTAGQILEDLYKVFNKKEEAEEGLTPENRRNYSSKELRQIFIGTIYGDTNQNTIKFLRNAIDKMPDEWVIKFLEIINGDTVEKVQESVKNEAVDLYGKEEIPADLLAKLEPLAKEYMLMDTLKTRYSDDKDFYNVAVWSAASALQKAYELGYEEGKGVANV